MTDYNPRNEDQVYRHIIECLDEKDAIEVIEYKHGVKIFFLKDGFTLQYDETKLDDIKKEIQTTREFWEDISD